VSPVPGLPTLGGGSFGNILGIVFRDRASFLVEYLFWWRVVTAGKLAADGTTKSPP